MKTKIFNLISVLLVTGLLLCASATPIFANETSSTEEEILLAAREGMLVYDIIGGRGSMFNPHFDKEYWGYDKYSYLIDGIIDSNNIHVWYELTKTGCCEYYKTGYLIQDVNSLVNLVDKYFYNYTHIFTTEENIERDENGMLAECPTLITVNNETYIHSNDVRDFIDAYIPYIFDLFEVIEINNSLAKVKVVQQDNPYPTYDPKYNRILEIDMVKTKSGWKICGGEYFDPRMNAMLEYWFKDAPPITGDTTPLYLTIAAAALVSMCALAVRRKKSKV